MSSSKVVWYHLRAVGNYANISRHPPGDLRWPRVTNVEWLKFTFVPRDSFQMNTAVHFQGCWWQGLSQQPAPELSKACPGEFCPWSRQCPRTVTGNNTLCCAHMVIRRQRLAKPFTGRHSSWTCAFSQVPSYTPFFYKQDGWCRPISFTCVFLCP